MRFPSENQAMFTERIHDKVVIRCFAWAAAVAVAAAARFDFG